MFGSRKHGGVLRGGGQSATQSYTMAQPPTTLFVTEGEPHEQSEGRTHGQALSIDVESGLSFTTLEAILTVKWNPQQFNPAPFKAGFARHFGLHLSSITVTAADVGMGDVTKVTITVACCCPRAPFYP